MSQLGNTIPAERHGTMRSVERRRILHKVRKQRKATNSGVHDLTQQGAPAWLLSMLRLSLKYRVANRWGTTTQKFQAKYARFIRTMLWRLQLENEPRKKRKPWDTKARRFYVPSGSLPWKQTEQTRQLKARLKAFKKALKPTRAPFERALKRSMTSRTYNTVHKVNRTIQRTANTGRFIVKPADKGLGPCVMDTTDYTQRCLTFLGSDEQYRLLAANDSPSREQTLHEKMSQMLVSVTNAALRLTESFKALHIQRTADTLELTKQECLASLNNIKGIRKLEKDKPEAFWLVMQLKELLSSPGIPKLASFYALPKVHKTPWKIRPIVAATGTTMSYLSKVVDLYLQPLIDRGVVLKDSTHLLNLLKQHTVSEERRQYTMLIAFDVTGMYNALPHDVVQDRVMQAVKRFYYDNGSAEQRKTYHFLAVAIPWILINCIFEFAENVYEQTRGIPMGDPSAPQLANLTLQAQELAVLSSMPLPPDSLYRRFLDDGFLLWTDTLQKAQLFISECMILGTDTHGTMRKLETTMEHGAKIAYLDLSLQLDRSFKRSGAVSSGLFSKPMSLHAYAPFNSCHPRPTFKGILKAEKMRVIRASSSEKAAQKTLSQMFNWFKARRYPVTLMKKVWRPVRYKQRNAMLRTKQKPTLDNKRDMIPLVLPFTAGMRNGLIRDVANEKLGADVTRKLLIAWYLPPAIRQGITRAKMTSAHIKEAKRHGALHRGVGPSSPSEE